MRFGSKKFVSAPSTHMSTESVSDHGETIDEPTNKISLDHILGEDHESIEYPGSPNKYSGEEELRGHAPPEGFCVECEGVLSRRSLPSADSIR